jgi:flagellar basal-body rod protein FlgF
MDNAIYASLTRQAGLMAEMQAIANNIANSSTTGFRKEGVVFAEHVTALGLGKASLSMATASGRVVDLTQAPLSQTGGTYDFAIEGDGFFLIETPEGNQLTRAGAFAPSPEGELMTADGHRLLDEGGGSIAIPPGTRSVDLAEDGTLSADSIPVARIGAHGPASPGLLTHVGGTRFSSGGALPVEGAKFLQGFLENSNVSPVVEIARMIDVQRAYEMGQSLLEREDTRIRNVLQTMGR